LSASRQTQATVFNHDLRVLNLIAQHCLRPPIDGLERNTDLTGDVNSWAFQVEELSGKRPNRRRQLFLAGGKMKAYLLFPC